MLVPLRLLQPGEDARELSRAGIEAWAPVPRSSYFASTLGNIYNAKTGKYPRQSTSSTGYRVVGPHQVHRLVMAAFEGARGPHVIVHHGGAAGEAHDRADNRYHNLSYISRSQHAQDAYEAGEMRTRTRAPVVSLSKEQQRDVLDQVVLGSMTLAEAAVRLHRSSGWIHAHAAHHRAEQQLPVVPFLSPSERQQAREAAQRGEETTWQPWPGHPEHEISNLGRVRSRFTGKILRPGRSREYLKMPCGGHLHVAMIRAYGDPCPFEGAIVRHFPDPDKRNCAASNLRWGSYADSGEDSREQALLPAGNRHAKVKIPDETILEGFRLAVEKKWTPAQFYAFTGIDQGNGTRILDGSARPHLSRPEGFYEHFAKFKLRKIPNLGPRVTELLRQGASVADIAEEFGISYQHVHYYLVKLRKEKAR